MATEYKLSYTASEIDEKLGKIDSLATTTYVDSKDSEILADAKIYTNDQIASIPAPDVSSDIDAHDSSTTAHADIREQIEQLSSVVASKEQLTPEFANNIEECTDTTKLYVLPDGMIYAYILTEVEAGPSYKNWLTYSVNKDGSDYRGDNGEDGYRKGYRYSSSSAAEKAATGYDCIGYIPVNANDIVRIANVGDINENTDLNMLATAYHFNSSFGAAGSPTYLSNKNNQMISIENGVYTYAVPNNTAIKWVKLTLMGVTDNTIITINEEITESGGPTITYAWASTGHAFVPADYEDRIVDLETLTSRHSTKISALEEVVENDATLMFISPDGDDSNSGLTASTPKKTVKACVNTGATRISAKRGVYKENVLLTNIGELEILPTDNDLTYAVGVEREPIVFDTSDTVAVSSLAAYNSIKRVAYSNSANTQFDKVFTKKSQPPVVGDGYGSRYNSTIWLLSSDEKTVCIKLKPVLTVAECEAQANTFTYVSGYIYINASMTSVAKIVVPTNWETGFYVNGADRLVLKEVEVRFSGTYNIDIRNCAYFDFYKCACKYTSYGSGFHPFNSNGKMTACYATKNYDGYGISGYGHTTYVDCVSEFNFDDGMSHHSGTSGTVIGGRYEGNGKGGNTPAYGAKVNIYGGLYKDNASFGIGYLWATDLDPASGMVQGAVMVGNPVGLTVQKNCDVTAMDCIYQDNTADKDIKGNFTEISNSHSTSGDSGTEDSGSDSGYTNMIPLSINDDGTQYVGDNGEDGYKVDYRVSSSGTEKVAEGYSCTGFIPAVAGDTIRIKGVPQHTMSNDPSNLAVAYFFTSAFAKRNGLITMNGAEGLVTYADGVHSFTIPSYSDIAYFRVTLVGMSSDTIITVNEEITEDNSNDGVTYTNLLPTATMGDDQSTGWVEGKGYTTQARLSGSGGNVVTGYTLASGLAVVCASGYIPAKPGDVIRIKGSFPPNGVSAYVISYKDSTKVAYKQFKPCYMLDDSTKDTWYWNTPEDWYEIDKNTPVDDVTVTFTLDSGFGTDFNAIRFSGIITDNTIVTVNEKIVTQNGNVSEDGSPNETLDEALYRIKNWKYPIHEDAPVFLLDDDKPAIGSDEQTTEAVYAKYDALMAANSHYITKVDCGMASDGTTPIYVYHFKEAEPHYSGPNWSETKPVILVCSGVHPTEQTGVHSLYYAMEEITSNSKLRDLRRNVHFIVMPMINPTGFTDTTYGVRNPDGIQVHYNFEVDFTYPTDPYYVAHGNRNHGGETPLSIPETQYFDALMDEYKDNLAIVVSCHNNDIDEQYGTGFIWCSCATHFMCNLGFRFADKMSAAWREKHGTAFDEGVRWANEYALAQAAAGSSLFNSTYVKEQPEWDYRVGRASISGSGGTEYKQALKYGVHGINVETCDRCMVLDKDFTKKRTANVTTMGCETYINFFRTFMAAYDPKDKKDYAPNLPWNE